ncbi:MAG: type VI secretion system tip protein VgrG [Bacteroidetes bacterium]|nr:type VI secretion system tip protein VgrG [Bacteroidota bacterium]
MAGPVIPTASVAVFNLSVGGSPVPDTVQVLAVDIQKKVNQVPFARIVIRDGEPDQGDFVQSSSSTFVPGATIAIDAGYDSSLSTIFTGIITGQSVELNALGESTLEVLCYDPSIKMTVGRKCLTFSNQKDSDILTSIIGNYSGVTANVTATGTQWPEQVQYFSTDWDFVLARAEANGMIVAAVNGTLNVAKPSANNTSVLTVGYGSASGNSLYEFNTHIDSLTQVSGVTASSWDFTQQAIATGNASSSYQGPGNLGPSTLSSVVGLSTYALQTSTLLNAELNTWSEAQQVKCDFSRITGTAKFQGNTFVEIAKYITIEGLGDRFSGDYFVSGVRHDYSAGNWMVEVDLGLSFNWFTEQPDVMAPPVSGLLPGARGLMNGTVKQIDSDPDNQFRVLVEIPLFDPNGAGIWARLANFYATSGFGAFFYPEVGDEVVIGFLNEDPRYPVILGSMYSGNRKPFNTLNPASDNPLKAIVSKSGIYIQFDDKNKVLTLTTPGNNNIVFSDQDKNIVITDQNGNSIKMSSDGIDVNSSKNITVQAGQNLSLQGNQGVSIQSSGGDVQISGLNIKESAQMQYSAEGSMTAQVQGGTELVLKGAMVMIN